MILIQIMWLITHHDHDHIHVQGNDTKR